MGNGVNAEKPKNSLPIAEILVFAVFLATMLYSLMHSALWIDEWVEYYFSRSSIKSGEMYENIISTYQPPLYNFVMHFWLRINDSHLWFRLFNVFLGMGSGLFLYGTVKRLIGRITALLSVLALSVTYQWIYCVQECSEYCIMLFFLFAALYFYVLLSEKRSALLTSGFLLACVFAIYSQYGSVFVVLPLLLFFYFERVLDKERSVREKIGVTGAYAFCAVFFALPLYLFFLRYQMANNEIGENTVTLTIAAVKDFFATPGLLIGWFLHLTDGAEGSISTNIWSIVGVLFLALFFRTLLRGDLPKTQKKLLWLWLTGYVLHFFLVELHVYAMVHPGQSVGFLCRYSYFDIPMMTPVLAILISSLFFSAEKTGKKLAYAVPVLLNIALVACLAGSLFNLLPNWNKAKDDSYAAIWMEKEGWEDRTYLFGSAEYGFSYYIPLQEGYVDGMMGNAVSERDMDRLPARFWVWSSGNVGIQVEITLQKARELGYTVTVYDDDGDTGVLAFCAYEGDYVVLSAENVAPQIDAKDMGENKYVYAVLSLGAKTTLYNEKNVKISYHVYDGNGEVLSWDNERTYPNRWVTDETYFMIIDPAAFGSPDSYTIAFDLVEDGVAWFSDLGMEMPTLTVKEGVLQ